MKKTGFFLSPDGANYLEDISEKYVKKKYPTYIEVTERPDITYYWDFTASVWIRSLETLKKDWGSEVLFLLQRALFLRDNDIGILTDAQKVTLGSAITYLQAYFSQPLADIKYPEIDETLQPYFQ